MVFLKDAGCWVVLDRIATDRPREITPMWRFRPEREVKVDDAGNLITADAEGANLAITPVGDIDWAVELIRGRENPSLQGWYSEHTPNWEPNTAAEFTARIEGDRVFAWVMLPTQQGATPVTHTRFEVEGDTAHVRFRHPDGHAVRVAIPLDEGTPEISRGK